MAEVTKLQGQYLAFIEAYSKVNGRPPAEADFRRYFRVTPPSVVLTLEKKELISRVAGKARSIVVLLPRGELPALELSRWYAGERSCRTSGCSGRRSWSREYTVLRRLVSRT